MIFDWFWVRVHSREAAVCLYRLVGYRICVLDFQHSDRMQVIMTTVDQARGMEDQHGCWNCSTHSLMCDVCSCNESPEIAAGFTFSGLGCTISYGCLYGVPGMRG